MVGLIQESLPIRGAVRNATSLDYRGPIRAPIFKAEELISLMTYKPENDRFGVDREIVD